MKERQDVRTRCAAILEKLRSLGNPDNVDGMARYGINPTNALGVSMPTLRRMAKEIGRDHQLAGALWSSGVHEARILAALVAEPVRMTRAQADRWVRDLDSWDVCDQCCMNLFDKTPFAYERALLWSRRRREFVKRAGFALMAVLAWHDKNAPDDAFQPFLDSIVRESTDGRNFVKKAVNWALRHIGKRNQRLHRRALETARRMAALDSSSARWIARDALRELESEAVRARLSDRARLVARRTRR